MNMKSPLLRICLLIWPWKFDNHQLSTFGETASNLRILWVTLQKLAGYFLLFSISRYQKEVFLVLINVSSSCTPPNPPLFPHFPVPLCLPKLIMQAHLSFVLAYFLFVIEHGEYKIQLVMNDMSSDFQANTPISPKPCFPEPIIWIPPIIRFAYLLLLNEQSIETVEELMLSTKSIWCQR